MPNDVDIEQDGFFTKDRPFLRTMMLSLVYPAVLGTVLFVVFQMVATPLAVTLGEQLHSRVVADAPSTVFQGLKIGFVIVTVVFYHCDYFYITYTKKFGVAFFIADVAFLFGLYITLVAINPSSSESSATAVIAVSYAFFFLLYFLWDLYEITRPVISKSERWYYVAVLAWEVFAFAALVAHRAKSGAMSTPLALLIILGAATTLFIPITCGKYYFFVRKRAAPNTIC